MVLNIQYTVKDYQQAYLTHSRFKTFEKIMYGVGKLMFLIFFSYCVYDFISFQRIQHPIKLIIFGIAAFYDIFYNALVSIQAKRSFNQSKLLQMPFTVTISEESILTKSDCGQSKLTWDLLQDWQEGSSVFLVYECNSFFYIFPKRCFATIEDIDTLRKMLFEKFGKSKV